MRDGKSFDHYWRVRVRLPERFGESCCVLCYGRMNSCLVVFEDGFKVVTCRYYVRRKGGIPISPRKPGKPTSPEKGGASMSPKQGGI
jgi:hypothetical protein